MEPQQRGCVFGPVPSRRLGRSLGVDLVPFKTCTYDCIYCQLGRTTTKTVERREYAPIGDILSELRRRFADGPAPDYVTLAGSGEPTLHSGLAQLIAEIKRMSAVPVAVLTNGSLLWQAEVREALAGADLVIPSLDAGDDEAFQRVNRPHHQIGFGRMVAGIGEFRREFAGQVWLEVFLLAGLTAAPDPVGRIARIAADIAPDRVQLNSVARPPAEPDARPVSGELLEAVRGLFVPQAEVILDYQSPVQEGFCRANERRVAGLLSRRPCTVEDIAGGLGLHRNEVLKHVGHLLRHGSVGQSVVEGRTYYSTAQAGVETETP